MTPEDEARLAKYAKGFADAVNARRAQLNHLRATGKPIDRKHYQEATRVIEDARERLLFGVVDLFLGGDWMTPVPDAPTPGA